MKYDIEYEITRDVTKEECHWLDETIKAGTTVYLYDGCTYGCISDAGEAVSIVPNVDPFFEIPRNALKVKS
jgi:hypothetical protein